jgi:hypothetical protein
MKKEPGIHIRNILLGVIVFLYVLLLAPNLPESYRILINGDSVLLASIYYILLIISLYLYKGSTKVAVYIFFLLSLIFYAQRIVFLYIFPESIRYAWTVNYTTNDINTALLYLLICTIAVFIGFKAGEFFPLSGRNNKEGKWLPEWLYSEPSRMKFYIISICVYLIRIIMSVYYQHTAEGALLNTRITHSFIMKLILHLLFYFNFVQLIIFIILLYPGIKRKSKENILILIIFALLMLTSLSQGSKAAIISIALSYFIVKILLEDYTFRKKALALTLIIMLTFPVMAPLSVTVRTSIILGVKSIEQFNRIFKKANRGYIDDLIANSSRLGGVDWLAVAMSKEKKDELKECVNLSSLGQDAARRLIPVPNIFPDGPNMLQKYTAVVWRLPKEEVCKVTELPTFLGVSYLLFGYFAFFIVFLWGMISVIVMRSNISLILKALFYQHLVIQLFLGGDIVESVKAFFMAVFILWLIKLVIAPRYKLSLVTQKVF